MSEKQEKEKVKLTLKIPIIKAESETQTIGQLVSKSPEYIKDNDMEPTSGEKQSMSIRKRRNLPKNRGSTTRQREKTPEPGRTPLPHEDTPTSDDEEFKPQRNSREIEADSNYEEMRRLVFEKANIKDPVYDLDTDQLMEQRAVAALERRRRSISPFALPDKDEIASPLERKGSFIDPTNKLLSTNYALSPKDEDSSRRNSLTNEPPKETKNVLSTSSPSASSPKDSNFPYPLPSTPKTLDEIIYPDEKTLDIQKKQKSPIKNDNVFTFEEKETKQSTKTSTPKPETPVTPGELVTKVIQIERTPSKKQVADKKPTVEVRERIIRTPSRKMSSDVKPTVIKQQAAKQIKDETQSHVPPVKPARSKSATRFANKTSESEMSEDQHFAKIDTSKRRAMPVPRRYTKNKLSPKTNRSQSVHRFDNAGVVDKTATGMSQTSREIIELMQKARVRSLSIPKDDPKLLPEYKDYNKNLKTPNKTPTTLKGRQARGMSCPKTIQIISEKEILSGLIKNKEVSKNSRQSSGYIDASQSEYTSSCYSSSPSENEFDFDLLERTAELTRKLNVLSQEVDKREMMSGIILTEDDMTISPNEPKSVLRKRSTVDIKTIVKNESQEMSQVREKAEKKVKRKSIDDKNNKKIKSKWKLIANWQQFKEEQSMHCNTIIVLRNKCIINILLLTIMCGLGGMMFRSLEGSFENAYKCSARNVKRDFIEHLWRGSHNLREEDWKSLARRKLYEFENQLHTAHEAGVTSYSGQRSWNFMNSFVFCLTLITTVGYGHISPKTTYGRVATIVYAIIGIPLFLILLADFGKLFTRIIKFFWAFIRRFYYTRSCRKVRGTVPMQGMMKGFNIVYDVVRRPSQIFSEEDVQEDSHTNGDHPPPVVRKPSDVPPPLPPKPGTPSSFVKDPDTEPETPAPSVFEIDDEFNLPISVAVFILLVYIIIGAVVYSMIETWNFFESFYFIFISITTIGLGDFVPDHPIFMMASILYLVFGFALTSMFINVVQVKLSDTFKQASAKLGATIGLKVAEEDGSLVPITPPPAEIVPVHKPKTETPQTEDSVENKSKRTDDKETENR